MKGPSTIHRFNLPLADGKTSRKIPKSAKILFVAIGPNTPMHSLSIWVQMPTKDFGGDPIDNEHRRTFEVYGTGHPIKGGRDHIGSCLNGPFVWHVFEVIQPC